MNVTLLNTDIQLENERVLLLPFHHKRNQELKKIIFQDDIWEFMGMHMKTENDFNEYLANTEKDKLNAVSYPFLIIDKKTNRVAGSTRYGNINVESEKCEIGWTWYGKDFQGTGLNHACKNELLKFGFENIGFRRIQFSADEENIRSQKAILKLGATKEGVFRNNYISPNGSSRNDVYFSIIKEEWSAIKSERFSTF
ncbi:GNAT family protein [Maribacter sp. SA7]|uniref:GNAT family N-acetyltransferase n=1 Tax=Maribacter zhoushanensis TaxID=3030012 RepID=UPI0023ED2C93|nr:GNAT family protein [Maribacter zhoushanensis]MDF4202548.1 GNAT family protein [Maribacter zhoushanensis]